MKDFGNILESVADALSDSMASRTRRNAGSKRLIAPPPHVVDGPTFAYCTCRACRHAWSVPIRVWHLTRFG